MKNIRIGSFFSAVVLLFLITSGAYAVTYDYTDFTNVRVFQTVKNPPGTLVTDTWLDVVGKPLLFDTFGANLNLSDNTFSIFTNWNPSLEGIYGANLSGGLRTADLFIDNNSNGTFDYAIRLDTAGKGTIFSNPLVVETSQEWVTNRVIDGFVYGGQYNQGSLSLAPPVWAKSASSGSTTSVVWTNGSGNLNNQVAVNLTGLNLGSDWSFFWGTATCSNDAFTGNVSVPEPSILLLLGVGLIGLGGLRRKFKG